MFKEEKNAFHMFEEQWVLSQEHSKGPFNFNRNSPLGWRGIEQRP